VYNQEDINKIIDTILNIIPDTEKIILFGSYANGKAHKDSDLDFAVLTDIIFQRQEKLDILTKLRWTIAKMGYNTDIILKNLADYTNDSKFPTLSKVISNEGVQVWSRN
jgi:predicted nucleotidyltransferase